MLIVTIEYEDGRVQEAQDDFIDLTDACSFAFELADTLGRQQGDGHGPPRWVRVMRATKIEISISVVRGGFLPG